MKKRSLKIQVSPAIGKVSAILMLPDDAKCILVLAHGAGAGMEHPFMESLASSLTANGIATLRFNFPFKENNKGRPDTAAIAQKTVEVAIEKAQELAPGLPVFAGGKSFGGRMSSHFLAAHPETPARGIIFFGFPLHAPGKPSTDRADHLKSVKIPMLFLQGTKDALARWDLVESVCSSLRRATLVKIEGANHSFKAGKTDTIEILTKAANDWIKKILKRPAGQ